MVSVTGTIADNPVTDPGPGFTHTGTAVREEPVLAGGDHRTDDAGELRGTVPAPALTAQAARSERTQW